MCVCALYVRLYVYNVRLSLFVCEYVYGCVCVSVCMYVTVCVCM